jgi:hypothetical protein
MRIFVFGSNLGGRHGAGAAAYAVQHFGAIPGVGVGPQGQSYAIPTKGVHLNVVLPLHIINRYVDQFADYVKLLDMYEGMAKRLDAESMYEFQVTRIGCGYAGYRDEQIAPMFAQVTPVMCTFDTAWRHWLGKRFSYWGTF